MTTSTPSPAPWEFESEDQQKRLTEPITRENCGEKLKLIREISGYSRKELAAVIGVSEFVISRLETGKTKPTDDFMFRLWALVNIGIAKFSKMSDAEKENLSEYMGAAGATVAGIGGALAAVSASGTVAGLSAAGVTSGLAALGGGAMLGGLAVVAAIPVAVGLAGFGLVKGIKAICAANQLSCEEIDEHWEIRRQSLGEAPKANQ